MSKPRFIDLFAGCGGLSLGLTDAGWHGVLAIERDSMAFDTLRSNLVDSGAGRRYSWAEGIPKKALGIQSLLTTYERPLRRLAGKVELIAGGPPCQGFSSAGKRDGKDPRNQLLLQYVRVVSKILPKFILIENVKGIASKHQTSEESYADLLLRKLSQAGYACTTSIVKASECGVPQERPRYIVLGVRKAAFPAVDVESLVAQLWEEALAASKKRLLTRLGLSSRPVSCRDAISDLESANRAMEPCPDAPGRYQIQYGRPRSVYQTLMHGDVMSMDSMRLAKHAAETIRRFSWLQRHCAPGENISRLEIGRYTNKKHTQVVLHPSKPSRTLTTLPDDLIHYAEPRILTVREYARLQSFPDWFKFSGKYTTGGDRRTKECPRYTQVGNAVAPLVAQMLGYAVMQVSEALSKKNIRVIRRSPKVRALAGGFRARSRLAGIRVWRAASL